MEREVWLDNPGAIMANQQLIWQGLRSYGEIDIPASADPVLAGWLDLANAVADTAGDPFAERAGLLRWRSAWPTHPAQNVLLARLLGHASQLRVPQRVALLLPQSGRLESSGAALRDGFIAAYFDYGDAVEGMEVVVYDTADLGAANAYRMAVRDGADFVVGPLIKTDVAEVAQLAPAGPATLALNYLPDQTPSPPNFYQFALAPEHEAQRVAQRAIGEGLYNAVALVPDNDWGQRLLDAFGQELESLGGKLLAHDLYQPDASDFSSVIRPILHLDRSRSRRRALEGFIGQGLEFEPRRRQDIDFIFVAAQPQQARAIRPQLRFHYASSLPVFATAAAYSPDPELNRDIDGLIFAATPWEVSPDEDTARMRSTIDRFWPARAQHRSALYAMGYDAWRLVPLLGGVSKEPIALRGMTGELSLQPDGRVARNPALARIENGIPAVLEQLEEPTDDPGLDTEGGSDVDSPVLPGGSGSP
jgi:outer membrane PBP1 activator LpoA protein